MENNIKIIVATHKKFDMPKDDIYIPVQVGSNFNEKIKGYEYDNNGENISEKNPYYCELTGMYWAWKNIEADYIGLVHYRRHFTCSKEKTKDIEKKMNMIAKREDIIGLLNKSDIILPKKRNYYIENLYSHYAHTLEEEQLEVTRQVIEEKCKDYLDEFDKLHKRTSAHMFNMFVMKKTYFEKYCEWLFDILFEVETRIDVNKYDSFHARYLGRISEMLLDVWINKNELKYEELRVLDIQNINWPIKIKSFLEAKFFGKKYKKSF